MASPRPLPLSEIRAGLSGREFDDLRWYFTEAAADQSGIKSSHSGFIRKMEAGIGKPPPSHHYDFRRLEHIRRARKIEKKLQRLDRLHALTLFRYFKVVLPLIEGFPTDKTGKRDAARFRKRFEESFTQAMRAYIGQP